MAGSELVGGDQGRWWRFSEYELREGHGGDLCICPAAGAELETFSPWSDYKDLLGQYQRRGPGQKRAEKEPPYQSLLSLVSEIDRLDDRLDQLQGRTHETVKLSRAARRRESLVLARRERLILQWCTDHGHLGILPHRLLALANAPVATIHVGRGDARVSLDSASWVRSPEGWRKEIASHALLRLPQDDPWLTSVVPAMAPGDYRGIVPTAALVELATQMPKEAVRLTSVFPAATMSEFPLLFEVAPEEAIMGGAPAIERVFLADERWMDFFPGSSDAESKKTYPEPLSPQFWEAYGEPVERFLEVARSFKRIAELGLCEDSSGAGRHEALRVLNAMVTGVQPLLVHGAKGLEQSWSFPSQIAAFALMISQDLARARFHVCEREGCGTLFATRAYQSKYCSQRCRYVAQKRRQRTNIRGPVA